MRIWDLSLGYLNRGSLLGEHRELHGLRSILVNNKKGYSQHPETRRWIGCLSGLDYRHHQLAAEMWVRHYHDRTPVDQHHITQWPTTFIDTPAQQFSLLQQKYLNKSGGRIPLPSSAQVLWAQHKYSVMARDLNEYHRIGKQLATHNSAADFVTLASELVALLRHPPTLGRLANAIEHMWGHVSTYATPEQKQQAKQGILSCFEATVAIARHTGEPYLCQSTALSELYIPLVITA